MEGKDAIIRIKGVRDGLLLTVGDGPFSGVQEALVAELAQKGSFFAGSNVVLSLGKRPLTRDDLSEFLKAFDQHELTLRTVLTDDFQTRRVAREMGFGIRLAGSQTDLDGNPTPMSAVNGQSARQNSSEGALFLNETIRSGRSIYYDGHVVIMGDVNAGAEIIAGGNVIVWGRLRGLVHAGSLGDETAVICALDLKPTQLRIANQIAVPPQDEDASIPEQAAIREGQIVAEAWKRN
ncbi:MAG: septum site-determining protein MinC [Chloroflexota bacterium]